MCRGHTDDDEALADAIGPGDGGASRHELEPGLTLIWGWEDGRFRLRVASDEPAVPPTDDDPTATELGTLFGGVVAPEATPSPRTMRFATPPIHDGPGRAYRATAADADPRVARIFRAFDDVTDVLVGPDFVAVTISRPARWKSILGPMLRVVAEEFAGDRGEEPPAPEPTVTASRRAGSHSAQEMADRPSRRLERCLGRTGFPSTRPTRGPRSGPGGSAR